jgi:hypothetical protein
MNKKGDSLMAVKKTGEKYIGNVCGNKEETL